MKQVFLSYARLDAAKAGRLHKELLEAGRAKIWFDREDLIAGMRWRPAIRKAIRESDYFIALLSCQAVSRRGFRHSELREAIEVMREFPDDQVFLIPARLDDCTMPMQEIEEFTYADLFPRWKVGIDQLRRSLGFTQAAAPQTPAPASSKPARKTAEPAKASKVKPHYQVALVDLDARIPTIARMARGLGKAQDLFGFTSAQVPMPRAASITIGDSPQFHIDRPSARFYARIAPLNVDFTICLTQRMIAFDKGRTTYADYLASPSPVDERVMFVSYTLLRDYAAEAGVSFDAAIANLVTGQLVAYFLDMDYHTQTRDCPMDFDDNLPDLVGALRNGRFCKVCANRLAKNPRLSAAFNALLQFGRI